jgi:hypothetical protein
MSEMCDIVTCEHYCYYRTGTGSTGIGVVKKKINGGAGGVS